MSRANLSTLTGTTDKEEMYENSFVKTGLVSGNEKLPTGEKGFNIWKLMRRVGSRNMGLSPLKAAQQPDEDPAKQEDYGAVQINNWVEGWAKYVEDTYGHRNAFAAMAVAGKDELEGAVCDDADKADTVLEKVATKTLGEDTKAQKDGPIDAGVVQDATPILIDPDFLNTLRSAAPILDWIDVVAQAGFTASYNVISGRDQMLNWASESEVRDLSGESGEAFTLENEDEDMKIGYGLLDVSDFSSQAQSSLNFMDLEGTSMEVWLQGYAVEEAEAIFYGNPAGGLSDGSSHDSEAITGLHATANNANTDYTTDVSGELSGDKPLFNRVKQEVLSLVKDTGATIPNLGIATSLDVFNAMESEANVNVRLDSFDQGINFGRDPMGPTTLSISGVPVLPEPNVRAYEHGSGEYAGDHGDVFIFERPNVQRRALQPLSSTNLGQLGLANRIVNYQYEALVDRSQGHHTRVLEGFDVPELSA